MRRGSILALTAIAGFVDTVTFLAAEGLFAAHITGNFVVFGASLGRGVTEHDYLKLIAFPVFVLFVGLGAALYGATVGKRLGGVPLVLLLQGLLLAAVGATSLSAAPLPLSLLALTLVAAMGLQNSLHRYLPGPMTTVMTGTVMHWSAARAERLFRLPAPEAKPAPGKPMTGGMIAAFAAGCLAAGLATPHLGLGAALLPALMLAVLAFMERRPLPHPAPTAA